MVSDFERFGNAVEDSKKAFKTGFVWRLCEKIVKMICRGYKK